MTDAEIRAHLLAPEGTTLHDVQVLAQALLSARSDARRWKKAVMMVGGFLFSDTFIKLTDDLAAAYNEIGEDPSGGY